jgi:hypothetical protein
VHIYHSSRTNHRTAPSERMTRETRAGRESSLPPKYYYWHTHLPLERKNSGTNVEKFRDKIHWKIFVKTTKNAQKRLEHGKQQQTFLCHDARTRGWGSSSKQVQKSPQSSEMQKFWIERKLLPSGSASKTLLIIIFEKSRGLLANPSNSREPRQASAWRCPKKLLLRLADLRLSS